MLEQFPEHSLKSGQGAESLSLHLKAPTWKDRGDAVTTEVGVLEEQLGTELKSCTVVMEHKDDPAALEAIRRAASTPGHLHSIDVRFDAELQKDPQALNSLLTDLVDRAQQAGVALYFEAVPFDDARSPINSIEAFNAIHPLIEAIHSQRGGDASLPIGVKFRTASNAQLGSLAALTDSLSVPFKVDLLKQTDGSVLSTYLNQSAGTVTHGVVKAQIERARRREIIEDLIGKQPSFGVTLLPEGAYFRTMSAPEVTNMELCLFEGRGDARREVVRLPMEKLPDGSWGIEVRDIQPGQLYGYRAHGQWSPAQNLHFDPQKLLIDPYAHALDRSMRVYDLSRFASTDPLGRPTPLRDDNASVAPASVVIDHGSFNWEGSAAPKLSPEQHVVVELHPRGATKQLTELPQEDRGTFKGLSNTKFLNLIPGNVILIMPVAAGASEPRLLQDGLINYWNYNTIAFNAPDLFYARAKDPQEAVDEFKGMVKAIHDAGKMVILDVVYNHTAEGGPDGGPTFSFRGLYPNAYVTDGHGRYKDYTGCGSTLDINDPHVRKLVIDSLRQWVEKYHVDGFRFDLAPILGLDKGGAFNPDHPFFLEVEKDPVLGKVYQNGLLFVEPWGARNYELGRFRAHWREWNDKARDLSRGAFVRAEIPAAAQASISYGSSDRFEHRGRSPLDSVNFAAVHDGFTLRDVVSYDSKQNWANLENNRDGHNDNHSRNFGVNGATDNPHIIKDRVKSEKALLAHVYLSAGTPMIQLGDAIGHTQLGNNNAYCQDNEISWLNWDLDKQQQAFHKFVNELYRFRLSQPVLTRTSYTNGTAPDGTPEVTWYDTTGFEMRSENWANPWAKCFSQLLSNKNLPEGVKGDTLLVMRNGSDGNVPFTLPPMPGERFGQWELLIDTALEDPFMTSKTLLDGEAYHVSRRSIAVFRFVPLH